MKTAKKFFKIIGIIIGILVIALLAYLIYLYASYHRIEDNLPLEVERGAGRCEAYNRQRVFCAYIQHWFWSIYSGLQLLYGWREVFLGKE